MTEERLGEKPKNADASDNARFADVLGRVRRAIETYQETEPEILKKIDKGVDTTITLWLAVVGMMGVFIALGHEVIKKDELALAYGVIAVVIFGAAEASRSMAKRDAKSMTEEMVQMAEELKAVAPESIEAIVADALEDAEFYQKVFTFLLLPENELALSELRPSKGIQQEKTDTSRFSSFLRNMFNSGKSKSQQILTKYLKRHHPDDIKLPEAQAEAFIAEKAVVLDEISIFFQENNFDLKQKKSFLRILSGLLNKQQEGLKNQLEEYLEDEEEEILENGEFQQERSGQ